MKKISLLFACMLCFAMPAFTQNKLPDQLLGNWLSPGSNEWKFGFTAKYAVFKGDFWSYKSRSRKKNKLILTLQDKKRRQTLYITLLGHQRAKIGLTDKDQALYTLTYNEDPTYAADDTAGFKTPILAKDTLHLKGVLGGYEKKRDNYAYISLSYTLLVNEEQHTETVKVDSLGRFNINLPMVKPQELMIRFGDELAEVYAIPGQNLMMDIEINRKNKLASMADFVAYITSRPAIVFMDKSGRLNTQANDFKYRLRRIFNAVTNDEKQRSLNQDDYKGYRLAIMQTMRDSLSGYAVRHACSKKFTQYFEQFIRYSAADDLLRYRWMKGKKILTTDYLDFIKKLPLDDELSLLTVEYSSFLHEVSMNDQHEGLVIKAPGITEIIESAKAAGFKFSAAEEQSIKTNIVFTVHGDTSLFSYPSEKAANYQTVLPSLFAGMQPLIDIQKRNYSNQFLHHLNINEGGLSSQMLETEKAYQVLSQKNGVGETEFKQLTNNIKNYGLFSFVDDYNRALNTKAAGALPANAQIIKPDILKDNQNKVMESLLEKYRGKVVYVDFWAPWCGPCMSEMPPSKILREDFKNKDVIFLYLGVNCTEESWKKTIKVSDIEGQHYLLSKDEYALLSSRYQITGIPRYMLINKQGLVVNDNAKRPSEKAELSKDITNLLK